MRTIRHVAVAGAAALLLAAGCGGDPTIEDAGSTPGSVDAPAGDTTPNEFDGEGNSTFCDTARQLETDDPFDMVDNPDLEPMWKAAVASIEKMVELSPEAIKDDMRTLGESMRSFMQILEDANWDFMTVDPDVMATLDSPEFTQASDNIDRYLSEVCGIDSADTTEDQPMDAPGSYDDPAAMLESLGYSEAQLACLSEKAPGLLDGTADPAALFDVMAECGVDLDGQGLG